MFVPQLSSETKVVPSPEPKLLTPTPELKLSSATSSRKTSDDESLNLRNIDLSSKANRDLVADVWLRVVGEVARLVGDAAQSFEGICDDGVSCWLQIKLLQQCWVTWKWAATAGSFKLPKHKHKGPFTNDVS